jgi:hypothetical protein
MVLDGILSRSFKATESDPVFYFYCKRSTKDQKKTEPAEILRSIVRQLACLKPYPVIAESVRLKYKILENSHKKLCLKDSAELIIQLIENLSTVTIVIDSLDQCDTDIHDESLFLLLQKLKNIMENPSGKSSRRVKILLSSREDKKIEDLLFKSMDPKEPAKILVGESRSDMELFVRRAVEERISNLSLLSGKVKTALKESVIDALTEGAKGM